MPLKKKRKAQIGRKYLQYWYLTDDLGLKFVRNSYNSIIRQTTKLELGKEFVHQRTYANGKYALGYCLP